LDYTQKGHKDLTPLQIRNEVARGVIDEPQDGSTVDRRDNRSSANDDALFTACHCDLPDLFRK
jgi:hypothetical protein